MTEDTPPTEPESSKDTPSSEIPSEPVTPPNQPTVVTTISRKKLWLSLLALIIIILAFASGWYVARHKSKPATVTQKSASQSTSAGTTNVQGLQLDPNKNYGNKYANGMLPVGDGKYTTSGPKQGYVYACTQYAQNLATANGGAMTRGPWFSSDGKTYNINKKVQVGGSVHWTGQFSNTVSGNTRTIVSNDLPLTDTTGIFPIKTTDPAYQYDRNPNTITSQSFAYALNANPTYNAAPNCIGGTVGVMVTGVELNSAFDAGGRDAGAWEVQDDCSGHPQEQGVYHYHTLSSCIKDTSVHTIIGYALDGFPITGPQVGNNNVLTTSDLDECHGLTSTVKVNGQDVTTYHYVMTEDFPYSISCYRSTAIQPPGQKANAQAMQQGQIPNQNNRTGQSPQSGQQPPPRL